jgi:hypothetical protein
VPAVIPDIVGNNNDFPEEVVPLTAALLYDAIRAGFKLRAVEDPNDITAILGAYTDATVVDKLFGSGAV